MSCDARDGAVSNNKKSASRKSGKFFEATNITIELLEQLLIILDDYVCGVNWNRC